MKVYVGDLIYDVRKPEEGIVEIKTQEQADGYAYVAPELIIRSQRDPNNEGMYLPLKGEGWKIGRPDYDKE